MNRNSGTAVRERKEKRTKQNRRIKKGKADWIIEKAGSHALPGVQRYGTFVNGIRNHNEMD